MQQAKIDNEVINHLLFHKSLIDEKEDGQRINYYVTMLQKTNEGEHISIKNPFDRSCLLYTSPSPRDVEESRMPSSA